MRSQPVLRLRHALWLWLAAGAVCAQDITLQASVDRTTVRENESFTYILAVQGQARGEPDASMLATDFEVLQRSRNTSIQMVGGRTSQITEWRFQLMPRRSGSFTLPPMELAGTLSNPVEVQVLPALANDAPGDIFLEVEISPATAFVQSQVIYTQRLFRAVSTGRSSLTPLDVTGGETIILSLGEDREYQTVRDDKNFTVLERRYAVFPQVAGELTVQPTVFEAVVITPIGVFQPAKIPLRGGWPVRSAGGPTAARAGRCGMVAGPQGRDRTTLERRS